MTRMHTTMVFTFALVLLSAACSHAAGGSPERLFAEAGSLYAKGRYTEAIDIYHELLASGHATKEVYSNLGNAQFKNGRLAESILAYRRAARLDPSDANLQHNLNVANARLRDRVEPMPLLFIVEWWNALKQGSTAATLFWWSVAFFWLLAAFVYVFFGYAHLALRRVALGLGSLVFIVWATALAMYLDKADDERTRRGAVVMQAQVSVRSTPDATGIESFVVHEGLTIDVLEEKGSMSRVRLADGKDGWLPTSSIERI